MWPLCIIRQCDGARKLKQLKMILLNCMYMGLLPARVSVHYLCAWSQRRLEEGIVSPGMEL